MFQSILPIKLLLLERNDPSKHHLLHRLMCHEDQRSNFPEYWGNVRNIIGPFIMEAINNDQILKDNEQIHKITIEDVVRKL